LEIQKKIRGFAFVVCHSCGWFKNCFIAWYGIAIEKATGLFFMKTGIILIYFEKKLRGFCTFSLLLLWYF
jgi:hypothetical protein